MIEIAIIIKLSLYRSLHPYVTSMYPRPTRVIVSAICSAAASMLPMMCTPLLESFLTVMRAASAPRTPRTSTMLETWPPPPSFSAMSSLLFLAPTLSYENPKLHQKG